MTPDDSTTTHKSRADDQTAGDSADDGVSEIRIILEESIANVDVDAEYVDELPEWETTINVLLPNDVARTVAYRAGMRARYRGAVTQRDIHTFATTIRRSTGVSSLNKMEKSPPSRSPSGSPIRMFRSIVSESR